MKSYSIVHRLLTSTLLLLLVLWTAVVISVAWVIKHETDEIFDSSLQETAQRLLPLAVMQLTESDDDNKHALELDEDALEPAQHDEYLVYQVFHASGRLLLRSHAAPTTPLATDLKQGFQRTAKHLIYIEKTRNGEYFLALAEKASHRRDTFLSILKYLLMPLLALLPLSALVMLIIVRNARHPLERLDVELSKRGSSDLNPVTVHTLPLELQHLANTVNQLMHRLRSALESERNFTANSAHELRTPLAAALAQIHVLESSSLNDSQLQTLETIKQMLQRLQALSEKLLQLARAESGIAWKSGTVDLGHLLEMLCRDHQWRTDLKIHLSLPETSVTVEGDIDALGIVLGNLLENATKYAPANTLIQVELRTGPVRLRIINDCDPLPKQTLERLHERFYRARPESRGAGLGLSIVRTLLEPTEIDFQIHSPAQGSQRGFEAQLTWPSDGKPMQREP
jgi:two-component system OmpR family sensor kinase